MTDGEISVLAEVPERQYRENGEYKPTKERERRDLEDLKNKEKALKEERPLRD